MPSTSSSWPEANDYRFMKQALRLASRAKGLTSPNPTVGAVIAYKGQVVAQGYHRGAGQPHAEIVAIQNAHRAGYRNLSRCTLYVTLEPCSTFGRTPPCTDAIIQEKFQRVVIAALDPNPQHSGRALSLLKQGGIQVEHGLLAEEANLLNRDFNFYIVNRMPWVVAKYAMS
ncbi:MAG: bifunctional diaminohydroxyphosphoribosylaminopyrimidine deaminase/5-amino-6-(5-phosphoribosylamino)uracil reductase RibD, partial [Methylacidiphilales bacterium]|nr:bifunctional diaminohydroxyphosphoribosylaminopyrimidine deaminase/5-amino-6-(5-phosphoribosylamino)uracil reductase RibD [Candidatus Methylacidiphilales bacterium]